MKARVGDYHTSWIPMGVWEKWGVVQLHACFDHVWDGRRQDGVWYQPQLLDHEVSLFQVPIQWECNFDDYHTSWVPMGVWEKWFISNYVLYGSNHVWMFDWHFKMPVYLNISFVKFPSTQDPDRSLPREGGFNNIFTLCKLGTWHD